MKITKYALIVIIYIFVILILTSCNYTINELWNKNWSFKIPPPTKIIKVYDSIGGAPANGDAYYICKYNNEQVFTKVKKMKLWEKINNKSMPTLRQYVNKTMRSLSKSSLINKEINTFFKNIKQLKNYNLYYLKIEEDSSYFLALLNDSQNEIYIIEVWF